MNDSKNILILLLLIFIGIGVFTLLADSVTPQETPDVRGQEASVTDAAREQTNGATEREDDEREFYYVEVTESCNHNYLPEGTCKNVYTEPNASSTVVQRLREGMVLKVGGQAVRNGETWYEITFEDQFLRYPERVTSEWYVNAADVNILYQEGIRTIEEHGAATTTKRIVVDKSDQMLYAYEGDTLFLATPISTGVELSPTPNGTYEVFKKMPSRYMQGPIEGLAGSDYYDLAGVPWDLYFTSGGAVIHGAYWHDSFGSRYSHGCVNLPPNEAKRLYHWAPLGTTVTVQN